MKKYIKPSTEIIYIETMQMIAGSGDEQNMGITDTEYTGVFNSRGGGFWDDEEEEE